MKLFAGLLSVLILSASVPRLRRASAPGISLTPYPLFKIQIGAARSSPVGPGPTTCYGSLTVKFFPLKTEPFSGGVQTVSYRHDTQFSAANPFFPFCQTIGKSMSVVDLGNCDKSGLKKATVEKGRKVMVPVRTIVPKSGGTRAVISTPSCVADGQGRYSIQRLEFEVQLEFTDERKRDAMTVRISLPATSITYNLKRVGR